MKNKIATKARRHKGSPRSFIIKKNLVFLGVSWCLVLACLGGKKK